MEGYSGILELNLWGIGTTGRIPRDSGTESVGYRGGHKEKEEEEERRRGGVGGAEETRRRRREEGEEVTMSKI